MDVNHGQMRIAEVAHSGQPYQANPPDPLSLTVWLLDDSGINYATQLVSRSPLAITPDGRP